MKIGDKTVDGLVLVARIDENIRIAAACADFAVFCGNSFKRAAA